jgi:hypothetical protein
LKEQAKSIIIIAIFFAIVVVILDAFLAKFEIVNWIALGTAFLIFSVSILNSVAALLSQGKPLRSNPLVANDDELLRLEKNVSQSLVQGLSQPHTALEGRIKSLVTDAVANQNGLSAAELYQMVAERPGTLPNLLADDQLKRIIEGDVAALQNGSISELTSLLVKIEKALS